MYVILCFPCRLLSRITDAATFISQANETNGVSERQNIYVEFDPDDKVHYLLGHDCSDGIFRLVVDGPPIECKV